MALPFFWASHICAVVHCCRKKSRAVAIIVYTIRFSSSLGKSWPTDIQGFKSTAAFLESIPSILVAQAWLSWFGQYTANSCKFIWNRWLNFWIQIFHPPHKSFPTLKSNQSPSPVTPFPGLHRRAQNREPADITNIIYDDDTWYEYHIMIVA